VFLNALAGSVRGCGRVLELASVPTYNQTALFTDHWEQTRSVIAGVIN
jgi:hypothetical protein